MVCHMGRCPPKPATGYYKGHASWSRIRLLMQALNSATRLMVNCAMADHIRYIPVAPSLISAVSWITMAYVTQSYSISVSEFNPFPGSRVSPHCHVRVLGACDTVGVRLQSELGYYPPCFFSFDKPWYLAMPKERLKMLSRRGGSRGRAISQRSSPQTHSFTDVLDLGQSSPMSPDLVKAEVAGVEGWMIVSMRSTPWLAIAYPVHWLILPLSSPS